MKKYGLILVMISIMLLYSMLFFIESAGKTYKLYAVEGSVDMRNVAFEDAISVYVAGEIKFYKNAFIISDHTLNDQEYTIEDFPSFWQSYGMNRFGYASYELEVLADTNEPLSIELDDILTNYRIYWNKELIGGVGITGKSEAISVPGNRPNRYTLASVEPVNSLIIEVSDFDLGKGGLNQYFVFETPKTMFERVKVNLAKHVFIISTFLTMSFILALRAAIIKDAKKDIYLSLLLFIISSRLLFVNERLALFFFKQMTWNELYKTSVILLIGAIYLFFKILSKLSDCKYVFMVTKGGILLSISFGALVLVSKPIFNSSVMTFYFISVLILCAVLVIGIISKKFTFVSQAKTLMIASSFVIIAMIIDIIEYTIFKINTNNFQIGLIAFVYLVMYSVFDEDQKRSNLNKVLKDTLKLKNNELTSVNKELEFKVKLRTEELANKNKILEEISRRDSLTGLYNHKTTIQVAADTLKESENGEACVVMIDIDHFKNVNDNYGHQIGDDVIREFSDLFQKLIRSHDTIGRYGGEEFLLVLKFVNLDEAYEIVNRIRQKVEEIRFTEQRLKITFSAGIEVKTDKESILEIIERADKKLYRAKKNGRNRVEI